MLHAIDIHERGIGGFYWTTIDIHERGVGEFYWTAQGTRAHVLVNYIQPRKVRTRGAQGTRRVGASMCAHVHVLRISMSLDPARRSPALGAPFAHLLRYFCVVAVGVGLGDVLCARLAQARRKLARKVGRRGKASL